MKQSKNILLVCAFLLACVTGCQNHSSVAQPVTQDDDELDQVIEEAVGEGSIDGINNQNENDELKKYISKTVLLADGEEIESEEWVGEEKRCYRVRICFTEQPEGEYKHSRDYFFYMEGEEITSFEVDYPSLNDEDWDSDRYVGDACDFNAKLEDVTFDGKEDIVIFLGHQGTRGVMYNCVYIYTDTGFVYCKSFEEIPNYNIDVENELITGQITSSAASYSAMQYSYDASENRFVEINCTDYEYDVTSGEYIAK